MSTAHISTEPGVIYDEDDGLPMADNTEHYDWIVTIQGGLAALFRDDPDIFVAGNLSWYPVRGDNKTRTAPDAMVAFGRPKVGFRGSYKQWEEGGVPPTVVFEMHSPGNREVDLVRKLAFYDRYGVEEYCHYDPLTLELSLWARSPAGGLEPVAEVDGWVSPRLGVRYDLSGGELVIRAPDGSPLDTYVGLARRAAEVARRRDEAERERDVAQRQRDEARVERDRLAAKLRALGIDPEA